MVNELDLITALDESLKLSFEETNNFYFKVKNVIENSTPDEASRVILASVVEILNKSNEKIKDKLLPGPDGGVKIVSGLFRRVPS